MKTILQLNTSILSNEGQSTRLATALVGSLGTADVVVRDLAAIARQLRNADVSVEVDAQEYPNGVFALVKDPEGNPIQLWEPRGRAAEAKK